MYFVPCEMKFVRTPKSDVKGLIDRIKTSGNACVEIKDFKHKTANICANAIRKRIELDGCSELKVIVRKNRVFVMNTLLAKEDF